MKKDNILLTADFANDLINSLFQRNVISITPEHFTYACSTRYADFPLVKKGFSPSDNVAYYGQISYACLYKGASKVSDSNFHFVRTTFVSPTANPDFRLKFCSTTIKDADSVNNFIDLQSVNAVNSEGCLTCLFTDILTEQGITSFNFGTGVYTENLYTIPYTNQTYDITLQFNGYKILF